MCRTKSARAAHGIIISDTSTDTIGDTNITSSDTSSNIIGNTSSNTSSSIRDTSSDIIGNTISDTSSNTPDAEEDHSMAEQRLPQSTSQLPTLWDVYLGIGGVVLLLCVFLPLQIIEKPFEGWPLSLNATYDIGYPMQPEIVAYSWVLAFGVVVPVVLFAALDWYYFHTTMLEIVVQLLDYCFGFFVMLLVTEFFKVTVGRLRPDFLDRCQPDPATQLCTGNPKVVQEGRKSFLSGHTSTAFYIAIYMIIWMHRRWRKYAKPITKPLVAAWVFLFLLAAYVGVSRIQQFVHHPTDVIAGALLGTVVGVMFAY
ncbi:Phospholipid phosphatase 3 [Kappamyces sp. JEL0680]|nr:Phospholipid phosphatase 3 [Kappamyces sp. JEL0680]